jgi:hypothetical protein
VKGGDGITPLFSREGGSPVWIRAFAGEQACFGANGIRANPPPHTSLERTVPLA